jgi:cytochrome b pre-mRNA-processing protein 3
MDGQLREFGIGDMIVGKHIGKIMAAFGGRMGAYRDSIGDIEAFDAALIRNLYRGEAPNSRQSAHCRDAMMAVKAALDSQKTDQIVQARMTW